MKRAKSVEVEQKPKFQLRAQWSEEEVNVLRDLFLSQGKILKFRIMQECIPTKTIKQIKAKLKSMNMTFIAELRDPSRY